MACCSKLVGRAAWAKIAAGLSASPTHLLYAHWGIVCGRGFRRDVRDVLKAATRVATGDGTGL